MASLPVLGREEQEQAPDVGVPDHPGGMSCSCAAAFGRTMTRWRSRSWWSASSRSPPGRWVSDGLQFKAGQLKAGWPTRISPLGIRRAPIGDFIQSLVASQIDLVVDVRTIPRSRTNPQYNREVLPESLSE